MLNNMRMKSWKTLQGEYLPVDLVWIGFKQTNCKTVNIIK